MADLVTAVQNGEGIAGLADSSFLCAKKTPQPQPELLSLSTAAVGAAGPVRIWWQVLLVTRQSKGHFKCFPIIQPEVAHWIVQYLPLQRE